MLVMIIIVMFCHGRLFRVSQLMIMSQTIFDSLNDKYNETHESKISVSIPFYNFSLNADVYLPEQPVALVIFSHGSGSSRFSSKNNYVAKWLCENNIAALHADLLTPKEDASIQ